MVRPARRFSPWGSRAVLVVLIAAAYGSSVGNDLVYDELIFMERDARVHSFAHVDRIFLEALWSSGEPDDRHIHQYYRPLQLFPLTVSYALFGDAAWPSHLLSVFVHLCNCLLVLGIFRILLNDDTPALLATSLFAVHPGYSEAVFWASDIAGLGATFCTLAIFRLHLSPRRARWYGWLLTPVLFLCGLWFKESGILAPLLVGAYDLLGATDRGWRRVWRMRWRYLIFLPPFGVYYALRLDALGGALPGLHTVPLSREDMLINAIALLPKFVSTFVWPFDLNMYHDFNAVQGLTEWPFLAGAIIVIGGGLTFLLTVGRHAPAAFGLLWSFAAAAPHLLIRWPHLNVFAERYLYLPAVGLFLIIGYVWSRLVVPAAPLPRRLASACALMLVALFVTVDLRRAEDWRDEVTIYSKTLAQSARAEAIRTNLAVRFLALGRHDEGIVLLEELHRINPGWPDIWHNLGLLYMGKGDDEQATAAFERARGQHPFKEEAWLNLGYLYDRTGRREAAVETYFRLVEHSPRYADAWYNLAVVAVELGQLENARMAAEQVQHISPGDAAAAALLKRIATMREQRLNQDLAQNLAPNPATKRRCEVAKRAAEEERYADAIAVLKTAAWFDERAALPHHYLANAYYLSGRLTEAIRHQREAVRRAPDQAFYRRNLAALELELAGREDGTDAVGSNTETDDGARIRVDSGQGSS